MSTIDSGREQWSGRPSRGPITEQRLEIWARRCFHSTAESEASSSTSLTHPPDSGDCGGGSVSEELAVSDAVTPP